MTTWIAEQHVVFTWPDGTRRTGRIAIGLPVQRAEDCACELALEGMQPSTTIYGDSTLQALLLAAQFAGMRLHDFLSRGGRIVYPTTDEDGNETEDDVPLNAFFAAYLAPAPPTPPQLLKP